MSILALGAGVLSGAWRFIGSPLGGRASAALAVALGLAAVSQCTAKQAALGAVESLQDSIDAPKTGWAARLATCQANTTRLSDEMASQSAQVRAQAATAQAALAHAQHLATQAEKGRADAERKAAGLAALVKDFGAGPSTCTDPDIAAVDAAVLGANR